MLGSRTIATRSPSCGASDLVVTRRPTASSRSSHARDAEPFATRFHRDFSGIPASSAPRGVRQAKLRVGAASDPLEREADRIAETIVGDESIPAATAAAAPSVQRKCGACAAKQDDDVVRRKPDAPGGSSSGAEQAAAAIDRAGAPLAPSVRGFFESRFHRDFSSVRVHDDAHSAHAARAIGARAFTLGRHIAFARGEYAPATTGGAKLLAHELAHVVQQDGGAGRGVIARQTGGFHSSTYKDDSGGGSTDYREETTTAPTRKGDVISGRVNRFESAPASGTKAREEVSRGHVDVELDTKSCTMTIPHNFNFVPQATANKPICQEPPNATAVAAPTAAATRAIGQRFVDRVNEGLNEQFTARISGCANDCADRDIPIRVKATLGASGPETTTMNVVNRGGRGDAGTICAGSGVASHFPVHEGGHQVLGLGDEYPEDDAGLLAAKPEWGRSERVRTDLTPMGSSSSYGRFAEFRERHFRFAQEFLQAAFPGCTASIRAIPRLIPDLRIEGLTGYNSTNAGGGAYYGGGVNVGLPLTRLRQLELRLGAQGIVLSTMFPTYRSALLLGATAGLEARTSPGGFGATFGLGGSAGVLHEFGSTPFGGGSPITPRTSGYAEGIGSVGLTSGMIGSGVGLGLRFDAAVGRELGSDPNALRWYRLGLSLGVTF